MIMSQISDEINSYFNLNEKKLVSPVHENAAMLKGYSLEVMF